MGRTLHDILAANVRSLMAARGWTQHELGRRAGIGQTTVSYLSHPERGKVPTIATVESVASALGIDAWKLLVPDPPPSFFDNHRLGRILDTYQRGTDATREAICRVAEMEARYLLIESDTPPEKR